MQITFDLTEQDYTKFSLYHINHYKPLQRLLLVSRIALGLLFMLLPLLLTDHTDLGWWVAPFVLLGLLCFLFFKRFVYFLTIKNIHKRLNKGEITGLGSRTMTIDDEGIRETTQDIQTAMNWSTLHKFVHAQDACYLYIDSLRAFVIPDSVFSDKEHQREFTEFIITHMNTTNKAPAPTIP